MNKERAILKAEKLLRLAASSEPHEAAAAMRQAEKLMRAYQLDHSEIELSKVGQAEATTARKSIPVYIVELARVVCLAFGCQFYLVERWGSSSVVILGLDPSHRLAAYAFTVLRRQLQRDRAAYYRTRRGCRTGRIRRADCFALGWVDRVYSEVKRFAGEVPEVVRRKLAVETQDAEDFKAELRGGNPSVKDFEALNAGRRAARDVALHSPVSESQQKRLGG